MLDGPDLARDDGAQMQRGPETGNDSEIGFVLAGRRRKGVGNRKHRPDTARIPQALRSGPGEDHLVTHVSMHVSAVAHDARAHVADEPAQESVIAQVPQPNGDLC